MEEQAGVEDKAVEEKASACEVISRLASTTASTMSYEAMVQLGHTAGLASCNSMFKRTCSFKKPRNKRHTYILYIYIYIYLFIHSCICLNM